MQLESCRKWSSKVLRAIRIFSRSLIVEEISSFYSILYSSYPWFFSLRPEVLQNFFKLSSKSLQNIFKISSNLQYPIQINFSSSVFFKFSISFSELSEDPSGAFSLRSCWRWDTRSKKFLLNIFWRDFPKRKRERALPRSWLRINTKQEAS